MKNVALLLAGFLLTLSACSFKQDPLHSQSDDIKNGIPPEKVSNPKGHMPESFNFDAESSYLFKEGKAQTITINARANVEMKEYEIRLVNQVQFENIKIKTVNGSSLANKGVQPAQIKITWEPPVVPGAETREMFFELEVFSKAVKGENKEQIARFETIRVFVNKDTSVTPTILKIEGFPPDVREGEMHVGKVYVEDTAGEDNGNNRPTLDIIGETAGVPQISQFMSYGQPTNLGNGQWVFDVRLDLRGEVTATQYTTNVRFVARNRFHNASIERTQIFLVRSNLSNPQISWINKEEISFKVGQKNSYSFWIMDPKFEGRLTWSVDSSTDLSKWVGTAALTCKYMNSPNGSSNSQAICQLDWDIPADATLTLQTLKLNVTSEAKGSGDNLSVIETFERMIKVTP